MDVISIVGKEIATRFHRRANSGDTTAIGGGKSTGAVTAVTPELSSLLAQLWLLGTPTGVVDAAGNVSDTAENIETLVEGVLSFLCACSTPGLAALLLLAQTQSLKATLHSRRRTEAVRAEAIGAKLVEAISERTAATADEILGDITLFILHKYGQLSGGGAEGGSGGGGGGLPVHKETATVLCSVLPRPQALAFSRQPASEKQRQLEELRRIVWGLRIYYQTEGKMAGAGLTELQELVGRPLAAMAQTVSRELARVEERAVRALAVLRSPSCPLIVAEQVLLREEYHHVQQVAANLLTVRCLHQALSDRVHSAVIPAYTAALGSLRGIFAIANTTTGNHNTAVESEDGSQPPQPQRSEAVKKRIAYPIFMELADVYALATRTVEELSDADSLLQLTLQSEASYPTSLPEKIADDAIRNGGAHEPVAVARDATALREAVTRILAGGGGIRDEHDYDGVDDDAVETVASVGLTVRYEPELPAALVDPVVAECYPASFCALRGYCPVTYFDTCNNNITGVVETPHDSGDTAAATGGGGAAAAAVGGGVLVRGRPAGRAQDPCCPGFIVLQGGRGRRWRLPRPLYVCFADENALMRFAADPLRFLGVCLCRCDRTEPATTLVMGLMDRLPRELYIVGSRSVEVVAAAAAATVDDGGDEVDGDGRPRRPKAAEAGTQTGQIDSFLDHNYRWNEWDLRRQALKLANLMGMRTHSTQTAAASHLRRDAATQAAPPKEDGTQTLADAATQPPRVVQFLAGLRGTESSAVEQSQRTILY